MTVTRITDQQPPEELTEEEWDDRAYLLERYFIVSPDPAERRTAQQIIAGCFALLVVGLILVIVGQSSTTSSDSLSSNSSVFNKATVNLVGLLAIAVAIFVGAKGLRRLSTYNDQYVRAEPKPRDEEVDFWLSEDLARLRVKAQQTVGVPQDLIRSGPFYLIGPALPAYGTFAADGTHRYSRYEFVFLFVTQYNIVAHTCVYDFIHGQEILVQIREYAFRDIISVDTVKLPMGAAAREQEYAIPEAPLGGQPIWRLGTEALRPIHLFRIGVASGEHIQANIADMTDAPSLDFAMEPVNAHNLARAIRSVLREHSGGVVDGAGPSAHTLPPLPELSIDT